MTDKAICHLDAWVAGDEQGKPYLEQHTVHPMPQLMNPTFITGDPDWGDYTVEVKVKPLSFADMAGVVFRYRTNRHYYLFALTGGKKACLAVRLPIEKTFRIAEWRELGGADFPYETTRYYTLKVENEGSRILASIDGKTILEATDGELVKGKAGLTANIPARFQDFRVTASDSIRQQIAGRDEILIGYSMWDHTGRRLWSRDTELKDHADGIAMGNFSGDPNAEPRVYASGSDEGFLIFDRRGNILKHVRIGHAQSPTIGKYRPDLPGLQYITVNFWKNPGIVTLFDHDGNLLAQDEPIHTGAPMLPVNWRGDGQEFALLSGNPREGGMLDGHLRRAVMFPDDGHPDLAAYVADVTGDPRDEVILWDQERVWIYTQDRAFTGPRIYAPIRNPHYNESNYRTNVSLPRWVEIK